MKSLFYTPETTKFSQKNAIQVRDSTSHRTSFFFLFFLQSEWDYSPLYIIHGGRALAKIQSGPSGRMHHTRCRYLRLDTQLPSLETNQIWVTNKKIQHALLIRQSKQRRHSNGVEGQRNATLAVNAKWLGFNNWITTFLFWGRSL